MELLDFKKLLGEPYYENEYGQIYNMDCVEALNKLEGMCFNTTITSPPYNIGKAYESIMPVDEYIGWLSKIITLIYDKTFPNGNFLLNVGYLQIENIGRAIPIPYLLWDKVPFYLNQEIVWNYGAGVPAKKYLCPRNEKILWYVKDSNNFIFNLDPIRDPDVKYPNSKKNGRLRCNSIGKNPSDVWQIAKVTTGAGRASKERTEHPAQFPEDLITIIKPNSNDIILDPFIGSGTVGAVAIEHDRRFIGFEIKEEYCEIAKKRLALKYQNKKYSLF